MRGWWHRQTGPRRAAWSVVALVLLLGLAAMCCWLGLRPLRAQLPTSPVAAQFVGNAQCAACHPDAQQAWRGSHHDLAMQVATRASVLAPFQGERFSEDGITSRFSQHGGGFYVYTEGPDGRMREFQISHALGVYPLQQYLIPMPQGAIQAFSIAWDARARAQGGQRWFHLQAGQHIHAGDPLHWTGRQNNWNFMCAECHTTQFKKNYDPQTHSYHSSWSEDHVSCESCHGPGARHLAWAAQDTTARASDPSQGLLLRLNERAGVRWERDASTGNAKRSVAPASTRLEVEVCARCHAHRSQISDDYVHGKPLLDTHVPSLIDAPLFWPDGQMRAEVYNYASFQQSRMFEKGVTCSDCHNPHSLKLRAPGNATCLQCHAGEKYQTPAHHFHADGSAGASCAGCHMPTTTYMQVDPRHDHFIRVPRPDRSAANGTPNACNNCHRDKPVAWAAQWASKWYPQLAQRPPPPAQAAMVRASALARGVADGRVHDLAQVTASLVDPEPVVRLSGVDALAAAPPEVRSQWLRPLLRDPVRGVRIAAARWLAGVAQTDWPADAVQAAQSATTEYIAAQWANADQPEALSNLGMLYADQGQWTQAEARLHQAMDLEGRYDAAALNLADVYRAQGREEEARALLQDFVQHAPRNAAAQHALGLALVRLHRKDEALAHLRRASELAPQNQQYAYVYQLAQHPEGRKGARQ